MWSYLSIPNFLSYHMLLILMTENRSLAGYKTPIQLISEDKTIRFYSDKNSNLFSSSGNRLLELQNGIGKFKWVKINNLYTSSRKSILTFVTLLGFIMFYIGRENLSWILRYSQTFVCMIYTIFPVKQTSVKISSS